MPQEIERKFLVDHTIIDSLDNGTRIKQGYIKTASKTVVRIRVTEASAFLTLKGENRGAVRSEFEYAIPLDDGHNIIKALCDGPLIDKTRFRVKHRDHDWEIDVFHGENAGLVVAEVELQSETEAVALPNWVTKEVTNDSRYYNSSLMEMPFSQWGRSS